MKREQYANQQNHSSFQPQSMGSPSGLEQGQFRQPANRSSSTNNPDQGNSRWLNTAGSMVTGVFETVKAWAGTQTTPDIKAIPQALQKNGINLKDSTIEFAAKPTSMELDVEAPRQGGGGQALEVNLSIGGIGTNNFKHLGGSTIEFTAQPHSMELDVETPKQGNGQRFDMDLSIEGVGTHNPTQLSGAIDGMNDLIGSLPQETNQPNTGIAPNKANTTQLTKQSNLQLSTEQQQSTVAALEKLERGTPVKQKWELSTQSQSTRSPARFDKATGHINQEGLDLVKQAEGFRSQAYRDAGGKWTIGYGHTAGVDPGEVVSKAEAESLLKTDLKSAENAVRRQIHVPLTSNQFSALTSLAYNIGETGLKKSDVAKHLNAGNYQAAADSFGKIVHVGGPNGRVLPGLVTRRANERALFLKSDAPAEGGNRKPGGEQRPLGAAQPQSYMVQKGDTLSEIAQSKLGDANRWRELQKADGSTFTEQEARRLQPGTTVFMPGAKPSQKQPQSYTVQKGDTLSEIAQSKLGDANRWRELQKADGSTFTEQEARRLQPGTTVFMPGSKPPKVEPQPKPSSSSPNQTVVDIARGFLHVRERGENRGREVEMFQRDMRGNVGRDPWCMQFAQYCIKQAGAKTGQSSKIHRSPGCLDVWNKSPKSQRSSKPEVGSLVIFGGSGHVGIVEKVNRDGTFTTIEGNTSNPNRSGEEGVFRKQHRVGQKNIVGFLKAF